MALSAGDQQALDAMLGGGLARLVIVEREARQARQAVLALTAAQRTTLQGLGGGALWAELLDLQAALTAGDPAGLVMVTRAAWLRRERIAEAVQLYMRDHPEAAADLLALYQSAGGVVGAVDPAPINEAAIS